MERGRVGERGGQREGVERENTEDRWTLQICTKG
jgi:hypothetical protein